ncbi:MAG: hypothetical protein RIS70_3648 [Planctomycetota bacterium]
MQDTSSKWSLAVGNWYGVPVRIHGSWFFVAVAAFYFSWLLQQQKRDTIVDWLAVAVLGVLFVSVLLHDLAHLWAARRVDGVADEMVLTPIGGITKLRMSTDTNGEVLVALAGPIMNMIIGWGCCLPLLWYDGSENLPGLLKLFSPEALRSGTPWQIVAKLGLWVNHWLMIMNLIPTLPFDGGQIVKSLAELPRMRAYVQSPQHFVGRLGQMVALGLLILAICLMLTPETRGDRFVPTWLALSILASVIFISSRSATTMRDASDGIDELDQPFGYDFSQGYTSLERTTREDSEESSSAITRWIEQRREARQRRQQEIEAEDERQVDSILARLHEVGIEGLSPDERALLQRVSARYRGRRT